MLDLIIFAAGNNIRNEYDFSVFFLGLFYGWVISEFFRIK